MADEQQPATNWAQARDRINSGDTGDKVAYSDPASTPLGTDSEAGGSTTAPEVIAQNVSNQQHPARPDPELTQPNAGASPWVYVGAVAAVLVVAVLLFAAI